MNLQIIVSVLVGFSVISIGAGVLLARWARRAPMRARLQDLAGGTALTVSTQDNAPGLTDVVGNIGSAISSGRTSHTLREQLTQAGYHHESAAAIYVGAKFLLLAVGLLGSSALMLPTAFETQIKGLGIMMASMGMFFIPNLVVSSRRRARRTEIRRHLPDAIDLLEICASSGMGIDMAWNSVADEVRAVSPMLADEMALTNLEIHLGANRAQAMRHMAERTGADELSSLVAVLVQSERFGTSIIDALRLFATSMREMRNQHAQEAAEKMSVKLIFPMIMFIFPAAVLVMAGPAFMNLFKALKSN
jgi:tight adherence protein C